MITLSFHSLSDGNSPCTSGPTPHPESYVLQLQLIQSLGWVITLTSQSALPFTLLKRDTLDTGGQEDFNSQIWSFLSSLFWGYTW